MGWEMEAMPSRWFVDCGHTTHPKEHTKLSHNLLRTLYLYEPTRLSTHVLARRRYSFSSGATSCLLAARASSSLRWLDARSDSILVLNCRKGNEHGAGDGGGWVVGEGGGRKGVEWVNTHNGREAQEQRPTCTARTQQEEAPQQHTQQSGNCSYITITTTFT
jgi:hypothetical protein